MNTKNRVSLLTAILLFGPSAAFCWGPEGHDTIADIAEARLSPDTQAAIGGILGPGIGLSDVANYPDTIRYGSSDFGGLLTTPLPADKLTSPFKTITSGWSSEWLIRGVNVALALIFYGFGLAFLARVLRVRL